MAKFFIQRKLPGITILRNPAIEKHVRAVALERTLAAAKKLAKEQIMMTAEELRGLPNEEFSPSDKKEEAAKKIEKCTTPKEMAETIAELTREAYMAGKEEKND